MKEKAETIEKIGAKLLCEEFERKKSIAKANEEDYRRKLSLLEQVDVNNPLIEGSIKARLDSILADRKATQEVDDLRNLYIEEGLKRKKQIHAPRDKTRKYLLIAIQEKMQEKKPCLSACGLMNRFPGEENPMIIEGRRIYKKKDENGELKIIVEPGSKRNTFGERAFGKYYSEVKKFVKKI